MRSIIRVLLGTALGLALCGAAAAPAGAASVTTPNACQYSYDGYWRDMPITYAGTATPAAAGRGDTISLSGQTLNPTLPEWLAEYGYNFGLLQQGVNEIPTTVWLATRGVGTEEGRNVQRFETVARTTIYVDGSGTFSHADPFTYDTPELAGTTWTAKGGKVAFRQAGAGSLPKLPVGPSGGMQQPKGSVFILAALGSAQLGLDCIPGRFDGEGASYVEQIAAPFATVDVPAFSCLSALPAATNRAPVAVDFAAATIPSARKGVPYRFAPSVDYRLSAAYLESLYDAGRLKEGDNALSFDVTAAIAAGHASPGDLDLAGSTAEPVIVRVEEGGQVTGDVAVRVRLAAGTWTPAGGGPLELAAGPAGALGPLDVAGRPEPVQPYGSVYLRLTIAPPGEAANHLSLDCVSADATVAGGSPPAYSEGGNQAAPAGDAGRFELDAYRLDPFAVAPLLATVTPADPDPPLPAPPAPSGAAPPPPVVLPPAPRTAVAIRSGSLRVRSKQVAIRLRCAGTTTCRGTARLRSAGRVRLGKRGRKRVMTLTATRSFAIPAGATRTVKLRLGRDGRKLMASRKRASVRVEVRPRGGKAITRKATLRR